MPLRASGARVGDEDAEEDVDGVMVALGDRAEALHDKCDGEADARADAQPRVVGPELRSALRAKLAAEREEKHVAGEAEVATVAGEDGRVEEDVGAVPHARALHGEEHSSRVSATQ